MNEAIIGTELTLDELAQVQGGKNVVEHIIDAGRWVVKHADDIKKVYEGAKSVWKTISGWF